MFFIPNGFRELKMIQSLKTQIILFPKSRLNRNQNQQFNIQLINSTNHIK